MRRKALITVWVIPLLLLLFWVCGLVTGYSLGKAKADGCRSISTPWFSQSTCDNGCSYSSIGLRLQFSQYQCPDLNQTPVMP